MTDTQRDIDEFIEGFKNSLMAATRGAAVVGATVTAVYPDTFTVDVTTPSGGTFTNLAISVLKGTQGGNVQLPVNGSKCLITFKNNDTNLPQLLFVDQIDKWLVTANEVDITAPKTVFNSGTVGIPVTPDVVTRLNLLETQVNEILSILQVSTVPSTPYDLGALFVALMPLAETVAADIESTKVFNDS